MTLEQVKENMRMEFEKNIAGEKNRHSQATAEFWELYHADQRKKHENSILKEAREILNHQPNLEYII